MLPDDYLFFIRKIGEGGFTLGRYDSRSPRVGIFLWMHNLLTAPLDSKTQFLFDNAREGHQQFPDEMLPVFPTVPGLIPWASDDQGKTFYWWAKGSPNSWEVVADDGTEQIPFKVGMAEFLFQSLFELSTGMYSIDGVIPDQLLFVREPVLPPGQRG